VIAGGGGVVVLKGLVVPAKAVAVPECLLHSQHYLQPGRLVLVYLAGGCWAAGVG
jgi:hypothetical protein